MAKFKIEIDKDACIGCGACEAQCPDNFKMGDDSKARVKNSELSELGCSKDAKEVCPVDAIKIIKVE